MEAVSHPAAQPSTQPVPPSRQLNVAILVTNNFEQVELTSPRDALQACGARTKILSDKRGQVQGMNHDQKADSFRVDATFDEADPDDFDAALLPGGVMNSDAIRIMPAAQDFIKAIHAEGKPILVICHGAWLLVSSGLVEGKTMTSWPTLQDDIRNAGGTWVDEEVVIDGKWVCSRKPADLPAFNKAAVQMVRQSGIGPSPAVQSDG
jgi:protease I